MLPPPGPAPCAGPPRRTSDHPTGDRALTVLATFLGTLALAGCGGQDPPAAGPPPDPPSGPIRPGEPIPYDTLAEHLRFNTRSRMQLMRLGGKVVQVHGPVWKVEPSGEGTLLLLGTEPDSCVRAHFADADLKGVRKGQAVDVVGTFTFRGEYVLLKDASLRRDKRAPSRPAH